MTNFNKIIVIAGSTASGKSDIANELAYKIDGEVISADSMQIYKGMDIGTGKILLKDQKVKHWGLNIINPSDAYSVAIFQNYARTCIKDIQDRDKIPILCGGTGFYIRAVIDDYEFPKGEQKDNPIRDKYTKTANEEGADEVWEILNEKDPKSASVIHKNNTVRVIRALELYEEGNSYFDQAQKLSNIKQCFDAKFFGLKVNPEILKNRINSRVDNMLDLGLVDEVRNLLDNGYREALTAASAIGYKEIVAYFDGKISLDEAVEQIKSSSRKYAKRQRTWFNKDKRIDWIDYDCADVDKAVSYIIESCGIDQ